MQRKEDAYGEQDMAQVWKATLSRGLSLVAARALVRILLDLLIKVNSAKMRRHLRINKRKYLPSKLSSNFRNPFYKFG
jgi:hypothetical protein